MVHKKIVANAAKIDFKTTGLDDENISLPDEVEAPIQNVIVGNLKTNGLEGFEDCDDLSIDSNDVYVPSDFVCTPAKRTKLSHMQELGGQRLAPPNQRIAPVHKADPILDIVKIDEKSGEMLLTKQGSGLEVINQTSSLAV